MDTPSASRRVIVAASLTLFLESVMFTVLIPLLPHYRDDLGLSDFTAGLLTAAFPAGIILGAIPAGMLAARIGGRGATLTGCGVIVVASAMFGFAETMPALLPIRFLQGIGATLIWGGGLTWVASVVPESRRSAAIGSVIGVGVGGSLVGPPLGAIATATSPEVLFSLLMPLLIGGAVAIVLAAPAGRAATARGGVRQLFARGARSSSLPIVGTMLLGATALGLLTVAGPLRLDDSGAATGVIALVFTCAGLGEAIANPFAGQVADRGGGRRVVTVALVALIAGLVALAFVGTLVVLALLIIVVSVALGFFWAPSNQQLHRTATLAGVAEGHVFALFTLTFAGGQVVGGAGGGALTDLGGDALPCLLLGAAALAMLAYRMAQPTIDARPC